MLTLPSWFTFTIHIVDFNLGPYCFLLELAQISLMAPHLLQNSLNSLSRAFKFGSLTSRCSAILGRASSQNCALPWQLTSSALCHVLVTFMSWFVGLHPVGLCAHPVHYGHSKFILLQEVSLSEKWSHFFISEAIITHLFLNTMHVLICFPVHVLSYFLDDKLSETTPEFLYF